jgi:hypothetical protein
MFYISWTRTLKPLLNHLLHDSKKQSSIVSRKVSFVYTLKGVGEYLTIRALFNTLQTLLDHFCHFMSPISSKGGWIQTLEPWSTRKVFTNGWPD